MENYTKKHVSKNGKIFYIKGEWIDNGFFIGSIYHRLDGPAFIDNDYKCYYIDDKKYSEEEYWQHPDVLKYKQIQEAKKMLGIK